MFGAEYVSALNNTSMLSVGSGQIDKSDQIYSILFFSPVRAFWLKFSYVVWRTSKERFTLNFKYMLYICSSVFLYL